MSHAAETMAHFLADIALADAAVPVVANLTADYETTAGDIKANLAAQIDHPVRWEESIQRLVADGFDTFVEVGSGTVLAGLMKRLAPDAKVLQRRRHAGVTAFVSAMNSQ